MTHTPVSTKRSIVPHLKRILQVDEKKNLDSIFRGLGEQDTEKLVQNLKKILGTCWVNFFLDAPMIL
jgi:hypothetical protein